MGRDCRICGRSRPHEAFSGRGHADRVCKECQRLPRGEREFIERMDELYGFLRHSNISPRNRERIALLVRHEHPRVGTLAQLLSDIARVHPRKRHRIPNLARQHRPLFNRLVALLDDAWWDDFWSDRLNTEGEEWLWECWDQAKADCGQGGQTANTQSAPGNPSDAKPASQS